MERYFLGNNTAYGFWSNYESELKDKKKVILLKGGPGTGKSSILKRIAETAKQKGYDYELWYCSGDPQSLDGVYIKELGIAVVDATSPHAIGADLPIIKDVIYDLATSLSKTKLDKYGDEIRELIKIKKQCYNRAYQHLKSALCHFDAQLSLEDRWVNSVGIRAYATVLGAELRSKCKNGEYRRKVFTQAICPAGESEYFDHLRGRHVYKVTGSEKAKQIFFEELKNLGGCDVLLLNPLEPHIADGMICRDVAVVSDVGHFDESKCEPINLGVYEKEYNGEDVIDEKNNVILQRALAVECLNKARETHLQMEKYFVGAMDFENNEKMYKKMIAEIFG